MPDSCTLLILRHYGKVAASDAKFQSVLGIIQDILGLQYHSLIS